MSGAAVGLVLGLGLFSIWWSCWPGEQSRGPGHNQFLERLQDELTLAGLPTVAARTFLAGALAGFLVVLVLVTLMTGAPVVAFPFAVMGAAAPIAVVRARARHRRGVTRDLWPDVVDNVASAVRAGLALPEALAQVGLRGPAELRPPFAEFARDYRLTGRFDDCLTRLKDRLADPVADRLVESLRIARQVGGSDLGRVLRTLSSFLREDSHTRAELESRQSWTINAARLAVASPWIVLAMLATRSSSIQAYQSASGVVVLLAGGLVSLGAYRLMMRIARLPQDERVLR